MVLGLFEASEKLFLEQIVCSDILLTNGLLLEIIFLRTYECCHSFRSIPDFLILHWLTPHDFTRQGETSRTRKG